MTLEWSDDINRLANIEQPAGRPADKATAARAELDAVIEYDEAGIAKTVVDNRGLGARDLPGVAAGRVRTPIGEMIVADQPVAPGPDAPKTLKGSGNDGQRE